MVTGGVKVKNIWTMTEMPGLCPCNLLLAAKEGKCVCLGRGVTMFLNESKSSMICLQKVLALTETTDLVLTSGAVFCDN